MRPAEGRPDDIHQHSGWWIPLAFMLTVVALSGLFLLYYLRPGPRDVALTDDASIVPVSVRELSLSVPANYIRVPAIRAGGPQQLLTLVALLPDMTGYSDADGRLFATNAPDSPVINIRLKSESQTVAPEEWLSRIYTPYLVGPAGAPAPFGLTRYTFKPGSAYGRSELFVGRRRGGLILLVCERTAPDLPSPNCLVTDRPPVLGVSLSYRFKRSYLSRWQQIGVGVSQMLNRFQAQPR